MWGETGRKAESCCTRCDQLFLVSCQCCNYSCVKKSESGESQKPLCSSGHQRAALVGLQNRVGVESEELIHFLGCNVFKTTGFESQVTHIVPL